MTEKILCVDDDSNILLGYQRALRKHFQIELARGGEEGLAAIRDKGSYAVVVSDMRMPGMDGVEMLARARQIAPDTVRMMLTGNADQHTAMEAVNDGHIFRFLTKPCPPEQLAKALEAGLAQYRLIVAERELLSKTLSGSIKVLTDVLSLVNPTAFGRASRVRNLARRMAEILATRDSYIIEIAAMLSQLGCVAIPETILTKQDRGEELLQGEELAFAAHPLVARDLLKSIPRLEGVAEIIGYQEKRFDGNGPPLDDLCGKAIPEGSRILKAALDFDALVSSGSDPAIAIAHMLHRSGWYDPDVLAALSQSANVIQAYAIRETSLIELKDGAVLAADIRSIQGTLLCARGHEVSSATRMRLRNFACNQGIRGPIMIFVPIQDQAATLVGV